MRVALPKRDFGGGKSLHKQSNIRSYSSRPSWNSSVGIESLLSSKKAKLPPRKPTTFPNNKQDFTKYQIQQRSFCDQTKDKITRDKSKKNDKKPPKRAEKIFKHKDSSKSKGRGKPLDPKNDDRPKIFDFYKKDKKGQQQPEKQEDSKVRRQLETDIQNLISKQKKKQSFPTEISDEQQINIPSTSSRGRGTGISLSKEGIFADKTPKITKEERKESSKKINENFFNESETFEDEEEEEDEDSNQRKGMDFSGQTFEEMEELDEKYREEWSPNELTMAQDFEQGGDPTSPFFDDIEIDAKELENSIGNDRLKYMKKRKKILYKLNKFRMQARKKRIENILNRGGIYPKEVPKKGYVPPQLLGGFGKYFPEILDKVPKNSSAYPQIYEAARTLYKNGSFDYAQKKIALKWIIWLAIEFPKSERYKSGEQFLQENPEILGKPNKFLQSLREDKEEYDKIDHRDNPETVEYFDEYGEPTINVNLRKEGKAKWIGYDSPPDDSFAVNHPLTEYQEELEELEE